MKPRNSITVFVSSTSQDLEDYRAVARNVILDLDWQPKMMEHFGAMSNATVEGCRAALEQCHLMLLLVAWRQGWVPTVEQGGNGRDSITALELAHARAKNIPVLVLLAKESWPGNLWDHEQVKYEWVQGFRDGVNQPAAFFDYEPPTTRETERLPGFRAIVKQNLLAFKERLQPDQPEPAGFEFFRIARHGLLEGASIPVLGCGIYGDGPLSSQAIINSLVKSVLRNTENPLDGLSKEHLPLATAAEYRERFDGSRELFLKHFREILKQQSTEVAHPPLLDWLVSLEKLSVIVSATYDRLLEDQLERAGRKYVIVSHVLRSEEGEHGKVLILRPGLKPEFSVADKLFFTEDELVLYKPLGSPFVHDGWDPNFYTDTVVVTETDHALLLQRLDSPETGVPNPLRTRFRRSPLLFLGYTMNVWQYRLMMLIFQSAGRNASMLAVRKPDAEIEELAWNGLNTNLIRMDPNEFARSAQAHKTATE